MSRLAFARTLTITAALACTTGTDGGPPAPSPLASVAAPVAASLALSPVLVASPATSTGTVTLDAPALAGGATVLLSTGDASIARVPASVVVPAGATSASFTVTPQPISAPAGVNVIATYGGETVFTRLFVDRAQVPGQPQSLVANPGTVVGGTPSVGTVTLATVATANVVVALTAINTHVATVPPSVTVPAGASSASFPITTKTTTEPNFAVLEARANGGYASTTINTQPAAPAIAITSVTLLPNRIGGGGPLTARIAFSGQLATFTGMEPRLTSSDPAVMQTPPAGQFYVFLPGTKTIAVPLTTSRVASNTPVTLSVEVGGLVPGDPVGRGSATLTVTTDPPPPPDVVRIQSATFKPGGRGGTLTIKATSTNSAAILTWGRGGLSEGTMDNRNGSYEVKFSCSCAVPTSVTVRSNLGGIATSAVKKQ